MKCRSNTTRLFVTKDIYNNAWFARNEVELFARIKKTDFGWQIWFYKYHFSQYTKTLTRCLELINNIYIKYWRNTYA